MDKGSNSDLLSDLPLSIIHTIIALVPIRDAVRTSILSRQWRYRWATLPHLVFDEDDHETRLINFINQALLLHEGPIHTFKLFTSSLEKCYIDQWLLVLSRKDIRVYILYIANREEGVCINSSLYSCHNLTHLELSHCEIPPPPPTFKGFLCLRRLILLFVHLPSSKIESLVANSSLLEELVISDSEGLQLRIHAPNLKHFRLVGNYEEISLYAPLLSKLFVECYDIDFTAELLQQKSSVCNLTDFLGGFPNLEEFRGGRTFIEYLSVGIESCHDSLVFHHLRKIELKKVDLHDIKETSVVVRLIMGAPALQKLKISASYFLQWDSEVPSISFWDSECATNFTFERLKVIEMEFVHGMLHEMKFIKFLLASSPVLEKMILRPYTRLYHEQLLDLTAELLSYPRASTNARILFSKCENLLLFSP